MISLIALLLLPATVAVVFGLRSLRQYRRTGDTGWRSPARAVDPVQWWSRIVMGAGLVAMLAAPVLDLIGALRLFPIVDRPAIRVLGLGLAGLAACAILMAQLGMGASWRIGVDSGERTDLVISGAFGLVRNPIFTAMVAFCVGLVLAVPNPVALAGLVLAVIGIEWQVRGLEEPYLRKAHGTVYRTYAAQVGRFVPGIGRLR